MAGDRLHQTARLEVGLEVGLEARAAAGTSCKNCTLLRSQMNILFQSASHGRLIRMAPPSKIAHCSSAAALPPEELLLRTAPQVRPTPEGAA
jgi:hypothetical protein